MLLFCESQQGAVAVSESIEESLSRLGADANQGLSSEEAKRRAAEGASSEFAHVRWQENLKEIFRSVANPLIGILLFAGVVSASLGEGVSAGIIIFIVILSSILNLWQTFRSKKAVASLQAKVTQTATVLRDGKLLEVPRKEIVLGDIISLSAGDLVPADSRLLKVKDLHVQQAALTGESFPIEKEVVSGPLQHSGLESQGMVYLGTSVVSGTGTALVLAVGKGTAFGDVVERIAARPEETEFERGTRKFGELILKTVIFLSFFILVVNFSQGRNALESLLFSLALAVGLTPELLPMITTVTFAKSALRMAREKVIVKHLSSIQNLGSMDILCSDKTGTLTLGEMEVQSSLDLHGQESKKVLSWACVNSFFESGFKSPIDKALLEKSCEQNTDFVKVDELPFDFERRRLSIVVQDKNQIFTLVTKGAPESILECSTFYEDQSGQQIEYTEEVKKITLKTFQNLSEQGYRVIAVAYKRVQAEKAFKTDAEKDLVFLGFVTFADPLSPTAKESLMALQKDGVRVKILTGDNEWVTRRVCSEVGIQTERLVLGAEIEKMNGIALVQAVKECDVFARLAPAQKQRVIRALKSAGHVVGFLGDGINDAPSLHDADIGIAVASAVDVAREAADIVLMERNLEVLHQGILSGRRAFGNVLKYILMGTSSNFGNMFSMAGAAVFLPFLPMLPTQILLNNLLYDFSQISIPSDNVDEVYISAPHKWDIGLIRNFMLAVGPVSSLFDFLTFYFLLKVFKFNESQFHTGWFLESLLTQVLVLFIIRTFGNPFRHLPSKSLVATALIVLAIGMSLPFTPLSADLGFVSLPLTYFIFLVLVTVVYLSSVEFLKRQIFNKFLKISTPSVERVQVSEKSL